MSNVLMRSNRSDYIGTQQLAKELGVSFTLDPTITPMMDGGTDVLNLRISGEDLVPIFTDASLVTDVDEFCALPGEVDDEVLDGTPCSAGHTSCYITPYADVFPCVQFPLPTGNLRRQDFKDIWYRSPEMNEVRSIRARDLHTCTSCSHVGTCTRSRSISPRGRSSAAVRRS